MEEETKYINPAFFEWASKEGVNLEDKEDWKPWWECWAQGYNTGVLDVKSILSGKKPDK